MRLRLTALALLALLVLAACTDDGIGGTTTSDPSSVPTDPVETRVAINNFDFTPGELLVATGTTVEWQNRAEGTPHTATADDGTWDSGSIAAGGSFSFTFIEPGTYEYICTIHPSMTGTVIVEG